MPLSQCCRIIKHSGQGLGDVLQGYGWCRSCSRGLLVYLTNPISCSGAQVEPVPERFHLCGARCCWIFILRVWEICFSSMPDLCWDAESPTGSSSEGSSAAAAVRLQSLVNAPRVGGTWWAAPLAHLRHGTFSSLSKKYTGSSAEVLDLLLLGNKPISGLGNKL